MPCPVCKKEPATGGDDHRMCVFKLLEENKIQSVKEWEEMCKPKTIVKGRVRIRVTKE